MVDLSPLWIRPFLWIQKRLQRNASIESVRRLSRWSELFFSIPAGVTWEKPGGGRGSCEWLIPSELHSETVILYFHGGFTFPLYQPTRYLAGVIARTAGMRAMLVDFRLAPEHPFPAAVDDCLTAYTWLISQGGSLPGQVIFVGESAGGNLAIAVIVSLRDAGESLPGGAVLISPVVDFEGTGSFFTQNDPMADPVFVMRQLDAYRGGADPRTPLLSPIYAELQGLPPLFIQVGEKEILRSAAEIFAQKAQDAGVPTTIEIWPGMWHYWHLFTPALPEAHQAILSIGEFLKSCANSPPPLVIP